MRGEMLNGRRRTTRAGAVDHRRRGARPVAADRPDVGVDRVLRLYAMPGEPSAQPALQVGTPP